VKFYLDQIFDYLVGVTADGQLSSDGGIATRWEWHKIGVQTTLVPVDYVAFRKKWFVGAVLAETDREKVVSAHRRRDVQENLEVEPGLRDVRPQPRRARAPAVGRAEASRRATGRQAATAGATRMTT
jgi:hypothetical protein